jgi:hypothetical protein
VAVHTGRPRVGSNGRRCFENLLDMTATLSKIGAQHARKRGGIGLAIGRAAFVLALVVWAARVAVRILGLEEDQGTTLAVLT